MERIQIREAKIEDESAILNLIKSFAPDDVKYAKRYYDFYFEGNPITQEDLVVVAEIKNRVIGVCGYGGDYFGDMTYFLSWFVIDEKYRGMANGIVAAKLLAAVEKDLRNYNIRKLFVETEDHPGRCHGFQFEGRLRDYYGKGYDQVIFGKDL